MSEGNGKEIKLVCPCGKPLTLRQLVTGQGKTEWILGHLEKTCSPLIHHQDLGEVFRILQQHFLRIGRFPTAEDHRSMGEDSLLLRKGEET
jgi:hypothetical protein